MYGSGVVTGMEIIIVPRRLILLAQAVGLTACFGAAVGTTMLGSVACLTVATLTPLTVSTTAVCGWASLVNNFIREILSFKSSKLSENASIRLSRGVAEQPRQRRMQGNLGGKPALAGRKFLKKSVKVLIDRIISRIKGKQVGSTNQLVSPFCFVGTGRKRWYLFASIHTFGVEGEHQNRTHKVSLILLSGKIFMSK